MATASAAAAVAIAGGVIAAATPPRAHETMASTANGQRGTSSAGGQPASQGKPAAPPKPGAPLQVLSVTPANGGKDANGAAPIKITFNEAVAASTPMPTVAPKISGTWSASGDTITFQPALGWKPGTHVTVSIPGGKSSKYDDVVKWVSYFNGGDALHYFPRPGYGYYQSVGCVEMQLDPAKYTWSYTTYGSLVTVMGPEA